MKHSWAPWDPESAGPSACLRCGAVRYRDRRDGKLVGVALRSATVPGRSHANFASDDCDEELVAQVLSS